MLSLHAPRRHPRQPGLVRTRRRVKLFSTLVLFLALLCPSGALAASTKHSEPAGEEVCLSLRVLSTQAREALAAGRPVSKDVKTLVGIGWIEGYVVDTQGADIILLGRRIPGRPNLYLDDLVVTLRNVFMGDIPPYCSLDPLPENVLKQNIVMTALASQASCDARQAVQQLNQAVGPQKTVVGGVHRDSRHARVMVDADYHMKKLSQGLISVPEVRSIPDRMIAKAESLVNAGIDPVVSSDASQSRFWFHIRKGGDVTFFASPDGVLLEACPVGLLTEKQRNTADGQLYDSGESDPDAEAFADDMSEYFPQMAKTVPSYADLENLYRLRALCCALSIRNEFQKAGVDPDYFLATHRWQMDKPMPPTLPGLANAKDWSRTMGSGNVIRKFLLTPMVCGGVSMEMVVKDPQFLTDGTGHLDRLRVAMLESRPGKDSLWWSLARKRSEDVLQTTDPIAKPSDLERPDTNASDNSEERPGARPAYGREAPEYVRRGLEQYTMKP